MDDLINELFSTRESESEIESSKTITPRQMRRFAKNRMQMKEKEANASEILGDLPIKGESVHMVSSGKFDYWSFVPVILEKSGSFADEAYFSTWTTNRNCTQQLLELIDSNKIKKVTYITGIYFKRRETAVYASLLTGLEHRLMRLKALENHAKIILMKIGDDHFVMEGSANFTSNPRIEQNTLTNDEELYNFHKEWIESIFD